MAHVLPISSVVAAVYSPRVSSSGRGLLALALSAAALGSAWPAVAQPSPTEPPRVRFDREPVTPIAWAGPAPAGPAAAPIQHPPLPASRLDLRSHFLAFGSVAADEASERPEAILVRVVSENPWFLWLTCGGVLVEGQGRRLPASRLAWRGVGGGEFQRLPTGTPVLVARGPATGPAGEPVSIDLRLEVDDNDPMGGLRADLRLQLAN